MRSQQRALLLRFGVCRVSFSAWADGRAPSASLQGARVCAGAWASSVGVRELLGVAASVFSCLSGPRTPVCRFNTFELRGVHVRHQRQVNENREEL